MKKIILVLTLFFSVSLFAVESGSIIVKSDASDIIWHTELHESQLDWDTADQYCTGLIFNGTDKWRLPTLNELINKKGKFKRSYSEFYSYYWSSTIYTKNPDYAWAVTNTKYKDYLSKELKNFVGCVANKELKSEIVQKKLVNKELIVPKSKLLLSKAKKVEEKVRVEEIVEIKKEIIKTEVIKKEIAKKDNIEKSLKDEIKSTTTEVKSAEEGEISDDEALVRNIFLVLLVLLII